MPEATTRTPVARQTAGVLDHLLWALPLPGHPLPEDPESLPGAFQAASWGLTAGWHPDIFYGATHSCLERCQVPARGGWEAWRGSVLSLPCALFRTPPLRSLTPF